MAIACEESWVVAYASSEDVKWTNGDAPPTPHHPFFGNLMMWFESVEKLISAAIQSKK